MKQQINEIRRMQQLAGILKENTEPTDIKMHLARYYDDSGDDYVAFFKDEATFKQNDNASRDLIKKKYLDDEGGVYIQDPNGSEATEKDMKVLNDELKDKIKNGEIVVASVGGTFNFKSMTSTR